MLDKIKKNPALYVKALTIVYLVVDTLLGIVNYTIYKNKYNMFTPTYFVYLILSIIPIIIFVVYVSSFYGKNQNHVLLKVFLIIKLALNFYSNVTGVNSFVGSVATLFDTNNLITNNIRAAAFNGVLGYLISWVYLAINLLFVIDAFSDFKYHKHSLNAVKTMVVVFIVANVAYLIQVFFANSQDLIISITNLLRSVFGGLWVVAYYIFWKWALVPQPKANTDNSSQEIDTTSSVEG